MRSHDFVLQDRIYRKKAGAVSTTNIAPRPTPSGGDAAIVVGGSSGGIDALMELLPCAARHAAGGGAGARCTCPGTGAACWWKIFSPAAPAAARGAGQGRHHARVGRLCATGLPPAGRQWAPGPHGRAVGGPAPAIFGAPPSTICPVGGGPRWSWWSRAHPLLGANEDGVHGLSHSGGGRPRPSCKTWPAPACPTCPQAALTAVAVDQIPPRSLHPARPPADLHQRQQL